MKTIVHNHTSFSTGDINKMTFIGLTINKWRGGNITLYAHPTDSTRVISVGVTFDNSMCVIADEERSAWNTAIDYIDHGKVYTSE